MKNNHPTLQFVDSLDQLREQHRLLSDKLQQFVVIDDVIRDNRSDIDWYGTLRDLRRRVQAFAAELESHAEAEERALFPTLSLYAEPDDSVQDIIGRDHRLALQYLNAFLNELNMMVSPICRGDAIRLMTLLMNGHDLLLDYFMEEERHLFPLAEQIITDIEYLSC